MKKPQFVENEIYHVYNRGVEKRDVFLDEKDYLRFLYGLFEFNDVKPATASNLKFSERQPRNTNARKLRSCLEVRPLNIENKQKLVDILAFCLMPNHFHMLVQQKEDGGIVKFMQKLGTGYTMYFNKKYQRVGGLFQGGFKATLIERDAHFLHIPNYIHGNPLEMLTMESKNAGSDNAEQALERLESYPWSSFIDYIGKRDLSWIVSPQFFLETYGGPENYKKQFLEWMNYKTERAALQKILEA